MDFHERLTKLLKSKSLSQKELAEKIGIRRPLISEWKRNKSFPYADVAVKISKIMNISVDYLLTGTDVTGLNKDELDVVTKYKKLSHYDKQNVIALINSMLSAPTVKKKKTPSDKNDFF